MSGDQMTPEQIAEAIGTYFVGAWGEAMAGVRGEGWEADAAREAASQWLTPPADDGIFEGTRVEIVRTLTEDDDLVRVDYDDSAPLIELLGLVEFARDTILRDRMEPTP